jgi:hypothetical protein
MNNNSDNSKNSNNSNNSNLGPSLSQGQIFRNQQQTRVLTNNDVVTGNATREQNKNKVNKQKNGKTAMAMIEPFSQKNSINNNISSNNYIPVSKGDIERDDERIKRKNQSEKAQTQKSITSYSDASSVLNKFQQGVTDEAKSYNYINKNPGLLNQNYSTDDNKTIRVNNKGVINTLDPKSVRSVPPRMPGINISTSIADPPPGVNYIPVENIPAGLTKGSDAGLYDEKTSTIPINMHTAYKLEGENVFVAYPYPNGPADINKNMGYIGAYTKEGVLGLTLDSAMPTESTLNCLQRAVDKGSSWCGMTQYGSAQGGGGGGKCMIGTPTSLTHRAYKIIPILQSGSNTILKHPTGYTTLTFGADGVLYSGHENYKFAYPLTKIFSSELEPTHGGTINNLVASYAYNQGRWQNLSSFSGNSDLTGQSSGTLNSLYQYNVQVPNISYHTQTYNTIWGQQSYQVPYVYYTTRTEQQLAAPNTSYGNLTYINYNCGKVPTKTPINIGGQNAGAGYNISCMDLHSKYPSFTLELSDTGILTITNNTSAAEANADSKKVTYDMSFEYKTATLSNKQVVTLNMPRPEWVSGSIHNGQPLTASSKNIHSITNGKWISSPNGYCRLILTNGTLHLEYSLQDVSQDKDGNLVGNGSSIALYSIQNVNASNLGVTAHIDINGAVNPYPSLPSSITAYDNKYTEMKGYIPNTSTLNKPGSGNVTANSNDSQCRIECNNDKTCAGYVLYNGSCNRLTADKIFPTGDRIPDPQNTTYIRNPMFPQNDKSCRKTLDAVIDSNAYSYYLGNGITAKSGTNMLPATKCNLGKVLDRQMKELDTKNQDAVKKGKEIKRQFKRLFGRENKVLNSITDNRTISKIYDEYTKKATDKIQSIKNAQITKSAVEKDSDLLLINDNYRYVIWGIVSLLLSIVTIKGLRAASE